MRLIDADELKQRLLTTTGIFDDAGVFLLPLQVVLGQIDFMQSSKEWVPTSERLPEEKQDVLMQFSSSMSVGFWETVFDEITWYVNTGDGYFTGMDGIGDCEPIAWITLPKPYKGGDTE